MNEWEESFEFVVVVVTVFVEEGEAFILGLVRSIVYGEFFQFLGLNLIV